MLTIKAMIFEYEIMFSSEHNIIIIAVSLQAILGMAYVIKSSEHQVWMRVHVELHARSKRITVVYYPWLIKPLHDVRAINYIDNISNL